MPDQQPRPSSWFEVKIGGREAAGVFKEASGFDNESEVIEHQSVDANGIPVTRKVMGKTKWSDVTLKRGVDEDATLWKWRADCIKKGPDAVRTDCTISLLDYTGKPIVTFTLLQAWCKSYKGMSLNAGANEVALEECVICHEGCEREGG